MQSISRNPSASTDVFVRTRRAYEGESARRGETRGRQRRFFGPPQCYRGSVTMLSLCASHSLTPAKWASMRVNTMHLDRHALARAKFRACRMHLTRRNAPPYLGVFSASVTPRNKYMYVPPAPQPHRSSALRSALIALTGAATAPAGG